MALQLSNWRFVVGKPRLRRGPRVLTDIPPMNGEKAKIYKVLALASASAVLAACAGSGNDSANRNVALGEYSLGSESGTAATVNRYLWAASLETLNFLPIFSADPIAGLVITDWYQNPEAPGERFKLNVYILDSALRADALRVSVFRQEETENGWRDATVNPATAREIENSILTRARQLRLNSIE